jgi:NhaP-type Na+/H+ or K+/H+ antiporter
LLFGYTSFRVWGEDKPNPQLVQAWFFIQPFLFGIVGASLDFHKMDSSLLGYSVVVILVGLIVRFLVTFVVTYANMYTLKERLFIAIVWIPKATV